MYITVSEMCDINSFDSDLRIEYYQLTSFKNDMCGSEEKVTIEFKDGYDNIIATFGMAFSQLESFILTAKVFLDSSKIMNDSSDENYEND